jgi:hypothetical protein
LAQLTIHRALLREGVLVEAAGELVSPGGTISGSLLKSCAEHLPAILPPAAARISQPHVSYAELAFDFALQPEGLALSGRCRNAAPGTLVHSSFGELLVGDPRRTYPLAAVVRTVSPGSDWLVPATDEARKLLHLLALPAQQGANDTIARQPSVRARLRTDPNQR